MGLEMPWLASELTPLPGYFVMSALRTSSASDAQDGKELIAQVWKLVVPALTTWRNERPRTVRAVLGLALKREDIMRYGYLLLALFGVSLILTTVRAAELPNLCPNPGAEESGEGDGPAGWSMQGGQSTWAEDEVHSGKRSLKITSDGGPTVSWTSDMIPVPRPGAQFFLSVWARMEQVTGKNGAFVGFYHTDAEGERIGQSGMLTLGGAGDSIATEDWKQYLTVSALTPDVKGVRVNVRLYGAAGTVWFDDIEVREYDQQPLSRARPLRRGLRLAETGTVAIVSAEGGEGLAERIKSSLQARGWEAPIVAHEQVNLAEEERDLIILGNLATSRAVEHLYRQSYTCEDLYFPGAGGYVLRPLIDPLGTGANFLVVGASDEAGLEAATEALLEAIGAAGDALDISLTVKTGEGYRGLSAFPWPAGGPRREMKPAAAYMKSGDIEHARDYREQMLRKLEVPDEKLFARDNSLHLRYVTQTQSWDLMESCGVFDDEERLRIANYLLKIMRSKEGYEHIRPSMSCRENHATRAARAFYYGWRHFNKYYPDELSAELVLWRRKLRDFWAAPFASSRSFEDSLSQHALGGSLDNTLDIAFMEPGWSEEFFTSGRARLMGERCIAISNNMGDTVLLGDTNPGDYSSSVFSKLAYHYRDGRYLFMIGKRGARAATTDEPLRGFNVAVEPRVPEDHFGLKVIPADELYFRTSLRNPEDVPLERAFDKLTFRSGFDAEDEYLMLDGVAGGSHSYDDANTIGEFSANGRRWLCEIDIFNGPTMSFHNAVTVARGGLGEPTAPRAAELVRSAQGDGYAYAATRLPHYNGVAWTRHLLWLPDEYTFVLDEMTALEQGDYSFVLGWRSLGAPELRPGLFESAQDEVRRAGSFYDGAELVETVTETSGKYLYHLANYDSLFYRADEEGDYAQVSVAIAEGGEYDLLVETLDYTGRATIQLSVDGQPVGEPIDLYKEGRPKRKETRVPALRLEKGDHALRFTVVGKHPNSEAYSVAICGVGLYRAGERQQQEVLPNRFRLLFPPDVPATLDRDTETLGKYLPVSAHRDQALNILEQSTSKELSAGQSACFQNLFYAMDAATHREVQFRRLNDHCALVECGGEMALVGAGVDGASVRAGPLAASGKLFYVSPTRVILHDATASLNGRALSADEKPDAGPLQEALEAAWKEAAVAAGEAANPWQGLPVLEERWAAELVSRPLSLEVCKGPRGSRLAVGMTDGTVGQWDTAGAVAGEVATGGPVHALHACDLDGDGAQELLVGSDDEHLYALDADLKEIWRHRVPFLREEQIWMWWTLGTSKVRKICADDINGDGKPEILVGAGNMRLQCLDREGNHLWRFRTDHGICTTIVTADLFGDGKRHVLTGNGLTSSNGICWVLDESGKLLRKYFNDSWCTSLPAIAVGDLDGDGERTVFCGNNRGNLRAYAPASGYADSLWIRNLTRPIRSLTIVPREKGGILAVGSDSGYLCAFDQAGEKTWGLPLSSAISHTALVRRGDRAPLLAAGCKDGTVFLVTPEGRLVGHLDCGARLEDMIAADTEDDGVKEVIVATSDPHRLYVVAVGQEP